MNELSDMELLEAYASHGSEEAFRELAACHVDLIYSAALRQLQNAHLAQEATQSAFIALAGKVGQLRRQTVIAGWLHRAAHFAALKLQRSEARRKHWEEEAATMNPADPADHSFEELALPHVDGALAELSEPDRDVILLRFLQQKSLRDVAQTLGTSEEAAKKRVSRALDRLKGLLTRRGVAIPAAVLAAGLSQMPVNAAPASLPVELAKLATNMPLPGAGGDGEVFHSSSRRARPVLVASLILLGAFAVFFWSTHVGSQVTATGNRIQTNNQTNSMKIKLSSVLVSDQDKAFRFYSEILGFLKKQDVPLGNERWLTVVSPASQSDIELLLEPMGFAPAKTYQKALYEAGIPYTSFSVGDLEKESERITRLGATFKIKPTIQGSNRVAVLDDTCGNLIQLVEPPRSINATNSGLKIRLASVLVDDQNKALEFYARTLGFAKKRDLPAGTGRWLTVVSPEDPEGPELLLEPMEFAPARTFQKELFEAGIPLCAFAVDDIQSSYEKLKKSGVVFTMKPTSMGPATVAVFQDTCGNLIQIFQKSAL